MLAKKDEEAQVADSCVLKMLDFLTATISNLQPAEAPGFLEVSLDLKGGLLLHYLAVPPWSLRRAQI